MCIFFLPPTFLLDLVSSCGTEGKQLKKPGISTRVIGWIVNRGAIISDLMDF